MKPDLEAIRARDAQNLDPDWPSAVDRRALLAYVGALRAAAGKVTCARCEQIGVDGSLRLRGKGCPDCADLRRILEGLEL
jgi:hypothetical protein